MINWQETCTDSVVDWLLEESDPSIRYFTLRDILNEPENNSDLQKAKKAISDSLVVKRILERQNADGHWEDKTSPYLPKYKSTYWTIMLLSQLGMNKSHRNIERACEFIFQFQQADGGFSMYGSLPAQKEYEHPRSQGKRLPPKKEFEESFLHEREFSCLTGNMVTALSRIGYADDLRVKKALNWLTMIQNTDGGWLCPYWPAHVHDKHGCFHGTICPLEAYSELPLKNRSEQLEQAAVKGAEFLLMHRLYKADHHEYATIKKAWTQLSFPWFYSYNILRGLDVTTRLGCTRDARLHDAVGLLVDKRRKDGSWRNESALTGRMQANIEPRGKPSKWVTLIALRILKRMNTQ